MMMILVGMIIGASIGCMIAALAMAAKRGDDDDV